MDLRSRAKDEKSEVSAGERRRMSLRSHASELAEQYIEDEESGRSSEEEYEPSESESESDSSSMDKCISNKVHRATRRKVARITNEDIPERSLMHASIVASALPLLESARSMSEYIQERGRMHASFVIDVLSNHITARPMKSDTREKSLLNERKMVNEKDTLRNQHHLATRLVSVLSLFTEEIQAKLKASPVGFVRRNLTLRHVLSNITMVIREKHCLCYYEIFSLCSFSFFL
ncbi:hypothetical protein ACROYT_G043775 [Oculina patagonica]